MNNSPLLQCNDVRKVFPKPDGAELLVLEGMNLEPLLELLLEHVPAPEYDPDHPLQAHVTNLDASPYVGRIAICRVRNGVIRRGETIAWCRTDGEIENDLALRRSLVAKMNQTLAMSAPRQRSSCSVKAGCQS